MTIYRGIVCLAWIVCWSAASGVVNAQIAVPPTLPIPLFPEFDLFGNQFEVIQTWDDGTGPRTAFSIYDTGASVVTFSMEDQSYYKDFLGTGVPIKEPGGASATAIGGSGTLNGDVSAPGGVRAAGISAFNFDFNDPLSFGPDLNAGIEVPGIQMFVGTQAGSSVLPTITGTPIHIPSSEPGHENGTAALIDMRSYQLNLEDLFDDPLYHDISFPLPDVSFVPRGHTLAGKLDTYDPIMIPVTLFGEDNTANPGNLPSASYNPLVQQVRTTNGANLDDDRTFLFDTGAQLTIISTEIAVQLGLDLNSPEAEIEVQGASGTETVLGFTIDSLRIPRDVPGTFLEFSDVPVYVLDIGEGIDGILGMNLFNATDQILYDPFRKPEDGGPLVSVTFLAGRTDILDGELRDQFNAASQAINLEVQATIDDLVEVLEFFGVTPGEIDAAVDEFRVTLGPLTAGLGSRFAGRLEPVFVGIEPEPVPEPASGLLATFALTALVSIGRRRRNDLSRRVA